MQAITRMRRRLRQRNDRFAASTKLSVGAAADVSSTIRRLLEAREKARTTIEQLKRRLAGSDLDWLQDVANEIATTGSIECAIGKFKELQLSGSGEEEKTAASLVILAGIEKLLMRHKKYHRAVVIDHLKAMASQLAQSREAHRTDRARLAARLENLLVEIKELEPNELSGVRPSKG